MIAPSFKRFWPADRLERLRTLQNAARRFGLTLKARNGGDRQRGMWLPHIAFWQGDTLLSSHWDLDKAEAWFAGRQA